MNGFSTTLNIMLSKKKKRFPLTGTGSSSTVSLFSQSVQWFEKREWLMCRSRPLSWSEAGKEHVHTVGPNQEPLTFTGCSVVCPQLACPCVLHRVGVWVVVVMVAML